MNSERATMERMYSDISEIRRENSAMKSDIAEIKNDICWIKSTTDNFNTKFSGCKVCSDPEEVIQNYSKLKKTVYELRDSFNQIKWTSAGISAGISIIILIIAFLYKLNST